MTITKKTYMAINKMFQRLSAHGRWTKYIKNGAYVESAKQALNCMIAFFLAVEAEHAGYVVKWENFPKITLARGLLKAFVLQDTSDEEIEKICRHNHIEYAHVFEKEKAIIAAEIGEDFCSEVFETIGSFEERIYRAATKIATYIEFMEIKYAINVRISEETLREIMQDLKEFEDLPGFRRLSNPMNPVYQTFELFSSLRYQTRWNDYGRGIDISVLVHSWEVAILLYVMSIEEHPADEKAAAINSFIGVFHDAAESIGYDLSSVIKDVLGIREAVDNYEMFLMEEYIYSILFDYSRKAFKNVMPEEEENKEKHPRMKGGDYLGACTESWRNILCGSRDFNFQRVIFDFRKTLASGRATITPKAMEFYEWLVEEVKDIKFMKY